MPCFQMKRIHVSQECREYRPKILRNSTSHSEVCVLNHVEQFDISISLLRDEEVRLAVSAVMPPALLAIPDSDTHADQAKHWPQEGEDDSRHVLSVALPAVTRPQRLVHP